jgi:hypothetical protein
LSRAGALRTAGKTPGLPLASDLLERHWDLFRNFDVEAFQSGDLAGMICQQPYAAQIQV